MLHRMHGRHACEHARARGAAGDVLEPAPPDVDKRLGGRRAGPDIFLCQRPRSRQVARLPGDAGVRAATTVSVRHCTG